MVDVDIPPPIITADILRLLDSDYMGHDRVDEAIGEIGDRSLRAEVNRYRRLSINANPSKNLLPGSKISCSRRMWRGACA
jgi:hypothetical protein